MADRITILGKTKNQGSRIVTQVQRALNLQKSSRVQWEKSWAVNSKPHVGHEGHYLQSQATTLNANDSRELLYQSAV